MSFWQVEGNVVSKICSWLFTSSMHLQLFFKQKVKLCNIKKTKSSKVIEKKRRNVIEQEASSKGREQQQQNSLPKWIGISEIRKLWGSQKFFDLLCCGSHLTKKKQTKRSSHILTCLEVNYTPRSVERRIRRIDILTQLCTTELVGKVKGHDNLKAKERNSEHRHSWLHIKIATFLYREILKKEDDLRSSGDQTRKPSQYQCEAWRRNRRHTLSGPMVTSSFNRYLWKMEEMANVQEQVPNGRTWNSRLASQAEAANENNIFGFSRETEPMEDIYV